MKLKHPNIISVEDAQEKMYQKMLAGTKLTQDDMIATFPVRKFQYYGNVSNPKSEKILLSYLSFAIDCNIPITNGLPSVSTLFC